MSQPRLNHIVLLHSHKERTDALDLVHIDKTFVSVNNRRQEFFLENFMKCLYMTKRYLLCSVRLCLHPVYTFLTIFSYHVNYIATVHVCAVCDVRVCLM